MLLFVRACVCVYVCVCVRVCVCGCAGVCVCVFWGEPFLVGEDEGHINKTPRKSQDNPGTVRDNPVKELFTLRPESSNYFPEN